MKNKIFLYLFVFTGLLALFLYMNSSKMVASKETEILDLEAEVKDLKTKMGTLQDSSQTLLLDKMDLQYFSLENNEEALAYLDDFDLDNPVQYISDKLLETNESEGDNPLVPYAGMEGSMKINKIKVLNHRWIIADFSDGKHWGELFIRYELKKNLGIDFTLVDHLFYAKE
ncbi:hydrolase [Sinomicrobium weinanense]|uniref:Hydrolase n=1 Tax=Sinomicrobium weinanense TaxID=2842200 RepID=A0A926Q098_9FLAO|nr:hydrolase [Sinomicrobium weinanense]MBC9794722.1 hydrolase [Sinomicrobium weinanense]MBU3124981.1 hydrolase [Sinomicrobium weinanense]